MELVLAAIVAVALISPTDAAFPADVTALMDTSVDPCDDFYQYTCGGWLKNHTLRASKESHTYLFGTAQERATQSVKDVLKEGWPRIGDLYKSCMVQDTISVLDDQQLQANLARIQEVTTTKELAKLAGSLGVPLFTDFGVFPDLQDAATNAIYVGSANLLIPDKAYYTDPDKFAAVEAPFRTFISTVATIANISVGGQDESNAKSIEDVVIDIEKKFAAIQPTQEDIDAYHSITYREAAETYPLAFRAMADGLGLLERADLTEESKVFLFPPFFAGVALLLDLIRSDDFIVYLDLLGLLSSVPPPNSPLFDAVVAFLKALQAVDIQLFSSFLYSLWPQSFNDASTKAWFELLRKVFGCHDSPSTEDDAALTLAGVQDDEVDQLFFVSYGQVWCNQNRDDARKQLFESQPYAPEPTRINSVMVNSEAFARAFQCPAGSKMNPTKKCQLW